MSDTSITVNEIIETMTVIADDRTVSIEDPAQTLNISEDNTTLTITEINETLVITEGAQNLETDSPPVVITDIEAGPQGPTGNAATVTVGSVTTVANGVGSAVANSGTVNAAVLDFTLEAGPATNSTELFEQAVSASTWTINHNQGRYPSIDVIDSAGTHVIGDISYTSLNQAVVTFDNAFAGKAIIV
jgi:hypothetical protein